MKRRTKLAVLVLLLVVGVGITYAVVNSNGNSRSTELPTVEVTRGDLVDKALAVGRLEPEVEISVKAQISGVVSRKFADVGDYVEAGSPLLEIRPTPTPTELVDARRQIEFREIELENMRAEYERQRALRDKDLVSQQEYDSASRRFQEARLQVQMARERLALLEDGRVMTSEGEVETLVRAPISGFVLDKTVEIGDPVVPLTSYQEGTVLMTMADMQTLILRGNVDEIDVGRLREAMPVEIKIGALPNADLQGVLSKIWLKAKKEENATVFPVEVTLVLPGDGGRVIFDAESPDGEVQLRAGYSANAEIIIERREDVLMIPERVVTFSGDSAKVQVLLADGVTEDRVIQTGLSDAINIEILSGLQEGERVVDTPPRRI